MPDDAAARRARFPRSHLVALIALVSGSLVVGAVQPSFAGEAPSGAGSPQIAGFGLGDGLEGLVDPRDGAVRLTIPVAGLSLRWDSRHVGSERDQLGPGWSWGFGRVDVDGGVRVSTASGEPLELSAEWTSGLAGYDLADRTFRREPGVLPAREDGVALDDDAARDVEFVLRELGGTTTYYSADGEPLAQVGATGERTDWRWSAGDDPRLIAVISADGVVTRLQWSAGKVEVGTAADPAGSAPARPWTIRFGANGVTSVTDPELGVVHVRSASTGLLSALEGVSGATTTFGWRSAPADGVPGIAELATTDASGARLSARTWESLEGVSASGWPVTDPAVGMAASAGHRTMLSDGASEVISTYDGRQRLTERMVDVSTPSGSQRIQEHAFAYADRSPVTPGVPSRDVAARPTRSEVTVRDASGASRTVTEEFAFDAFGRVISRTAADGTTSTVKYDQLQPDPDVPPMGLPLEHRTVAPDGSTTVTEATLNTERTATVALQGYAGPAEDALEPTGRTEFEVRADGFVTEQRRLPAEGDGIVVTRWSESADLARGEVTVTETVGVGTDAEASTSQTTSLVHGGLLKQVDALGNAVTHRYDGVGRVVSSTDAIGRTVDVRYETAQRDGRNAVVTTAADRVAVTEVSDVLGRVTEVTDNIRDGKVVDGHVRLIESRDHRDPGVVRVTDAWGATTVAREDALGRPVEAIAPTGAVFRTEYDDVADTVTSGLTPTGDLADAEFVTTRTRDAAGRVIEQTSERADELPVSPMAITFDGFGRPTTTRGGGLESAVTYDRQGNPRTTAITPIGDEVADGDAFEADRTAPVVAKRRFDPFGASLEKTLSDGTTTRSGGARTLDELGRTVEERDQADGVTRTDYTIDGRVATSTDASGRITELEYEAKTRNLTLSRVTPIDGEPVETAYEYDSVTGRPTAAYDPDDRRATEVLTTYDAHGNVLTTSYPDGARIEYGYDAHGRRLWTRDVLGNTTTLAFDDAGLLASAVQTDSRDRPLARVDYDHDWAGRLTALTRDNGVTTRYTYTSASQIATETTADPEGTSSTRTYTYDASGQLVERTDAVRGDGGAMTETTTTYRYDSLGRLVESARHDGASSDDPMSSRNEYTLNVSGDLVGERVVSGIGTAAERAVEHTYGYTVRGELVSRTTDDGHGAVTTDTAEYDADGSLAVGLDGTRYAYDAIGRRSTTTSPSGAETVTEYWVDGTRKQLSSSTADGRTATTRFYWSGIDLVNEVVPGGDTPAAEGASYLIGADRHARTTQVGGATETAYYGTDRHGSITDLTDARGAVAERYAYTDYGRPIAPTGEVPAAADPAAPGTPRARLGDVTANAFGYSGEYHDADGLQHLNDRDYDAITKRLISVDPVSHHNDYVYADGNPIMRVDPTGRTSSADALSVSFAVFGAVLAAVGLVTGGLALTPFGIAAVTINALDTAIAITEVVHVAGTPFLSEAAAAGLAAVSLVTGVATLAAGIRTAARKAATAATAAKAADDADTPYRLLDDDAPLPPHVPDGGDKVRIGDGSEALPAPAPAPISNELRMIVQFGGGTHSGTVSQFAWKFGGLPGPLRGTEDAFRVHSQIRTTAPLVIEYALRGANRPVVSMANTARGRVPVTLWHALESGGEVGGAMRPGLAPDPVALIRRYTVQYEDFRMTGQRLFTRLHTQLQEINDSFRSTRRRLAVERKTADVETKATIDATRRDLEDAIIVNEESQRRLGQHADTLRQAVVDEY